MSNTNAELFEGTLTPIYIRISRRMKNKLGHYMMATKSGLPAEIAISWRHIQRRQGWEGECCIHWCMRWYTNGRTRAAFRSITAGSFGQRPSEVGISARATRRIA